MSERGEVQDFSTLETEAMFCSVLQPQLLKKYMAQIRCLRYF